MITWICPDNHSTAQMSMMARMREGSGLERHAAGIRYLMPHQAAAACAQIPPSLLIVNDLATLQLAFPGAKSLNTYRGSVFTHATLAPNCLSVVLDSVLNTRMDNECRIAWNADCAKITRLIEGTHNRRPPPTIHIAQSMHEVQEGLRWLLTQPFVAVDIETIGIPPRISCIGFSTAHWALVVPIINPLKEGNAHWENPQEEVTIWSLIREFLTSPVPKAFQNYTYDCLNLMRYNIPVRNVLLDSMHLWHSMYAELSKSIDFIASFVLDDYCYWKDDIKGDKEKADRMPTTEGGLQMFWRYNGMDCINTARICETLIPRMTDWAWANYRSERRTQYVYNLMDVIGMRADEQWLHNKCQELMKEHEEELAALRSMVAWPDFNPFSTQQVCSILYDTFRCPVNKRKGRTADEKTLANLRFEHPLYARFITQLWKTKKPYNNATKYGKLTFPNGRFYSGQSAAGTETGRPNGGGGSFMLGTNPLNMPKKMRNFIRADEGYWLLDCDFAQSDAYFVAFESQSQSMITNMLDDRDTHCVHAAYFFQLEYDYLIKNKHEEWVSGPTGIRSIGKRIVHGANYRMAAYTLYQTMGYEAAVAAAKALHLPWDSEAALVAVCDRLLIGYLRMYPDIPIWFMTTVAEAVANHNLAQCYGGYTRLFLGDLANDEKAQRELSAFFGQGGTAGNMRRTLTTVFWETDFIWKHGLLPLREVYDSFIFQVPQSKPWIVDNVLTIMEQPVTVKGRTFSVPADAQYGLRWGKGMSAWKRGGNPATA